MATTYGPGNAALCGGTRAGSFSAEAAPACVAEITPIERIRTSMKNVTTCGRVLMLSGISKKYPQQLMLLGNESAKVLIKSGSRQGFHGVTVDSTIKLIALGVSEAYVPMNPRLSHGGKNPAEV